MKELLTLFTQFETHITVYVNLDLWHMTLKSISTVVECIPQAMQTACSSSLPCVSFAHVHL